MGFMAEYLHYKLYFIFIIRYHGLCSQFMALFLE
jgi:hypothetical protein